MKVILLHISTGKEPWADAAQELYLAKLKHFFSFEVKAIKSNSMGRDSAQEKKQADSEKLISAIDPTDFVVLLDERGKNFSSEDFAKRWQTTLESGKSRVVLVIGGAFGVDETIQKRANLTIKLSDMVFNHHLAKIVILEQLYRAMTILKGIPYHNK